jgi:diacylglycerol kinase (ATP)
MDGIKASALVEMRKRALLLHNPTAGTGNHTADALISVVREAGYSVTYCSTKKGAYKGRLKEPTELIVIAGGDGTVTKVIRYLPDLNDPIAILPLGTANNVARSVGIDGDVDALLQSLLAHTTRRLDVGMVRGLKGWRRFVEGVGIGALCDLMAEGAKPPAWERTRIGRERLHDILTRAPTQRCIMTIDGHKFDDQVLMLEVLNTRYIGPALPLGPQSAPGDQLLDVVYLIPERRAEMLAWLDSPERMPSPLTVRQGRRVILEWADHPLHIDDRCLPHPGESTQIRIKLDREGTQICVPPPSSQTGDTQIELSQSSTSRRT